MAAEYESFNGNPLSRGKRVSARIRVQEGIKHDLTRVVPPKKVEERNRRAKKNFSPRKGKNFLSLLPHDGQRWRLGRGMTLTNKKITGDVLRNSRNPSIQHKYIPHLISGTKY